MNKLLDMLILQDELNKSVPIHDMPNYLRAAWVECAELMDHLGYKWWKKATVDKSQCQMEIVDIWHFILSETIEVHGSPKKALNAFKHHGITQYGVSEFDRAQLMLATERLTIHILESLLGSREALDDVIGVFINLLQYSGMSFNDLYKRYVAKNVLNLFRYNHGYLDNKYIKIWRGKEDNEVVSQFISDHPDFTAEMLEDYLETEYKRTLASE